MNKQLDQIGYTPKQITQLLPVSVGTVLNWINSGKLKAKNVSTSTIRPRWIVSKSSLAEFVEPETAEPEKVSSPKPPRRQRVDREYV